MSAGNGSMSMRERVVAVLEGRKPDRLPFCTRLELWHKSRVRTGTLPEELRDLSLLELHRAVGVGQAKFLYPYGFRLRGVEVTASFEGEVIYREVEPVAERFPSMVELVVDDRPGFTTVELKTPVGTLTIVRQALEETVRWGQEPYPSKHALSDPADFPVMQYILERLEYVPLYDEFYEEAARIGDFGFVIPRLSRTPFQQLLLDYLGEMPLIYALYDEPELVRTLIKLIHEQNLHILEQLAGFDAVYLEWIDNLTGDMTNPKLFAEYLLPHHQQYAEIIHAQGRKVGSHTDGNLRPLLGLLRESGLDVCESFSPTPLTPCTFDEAWEAWHGRPTIWGGIPSPLLEERMPEAELHRYVDHVLDTVGGGPIILGVTDMILGHNLIDRVRYIAERVERHTLA